MALCVISYFAMKNDGSLSSFIHHSLEHCNYQTREMARAECLEWLQEVKCPEEEGWHSHSVLVSGEIQAMKQVISTEVD